MQAKNSKGEELYLVIVSRTNEATHPSAFLKIWEQAVQFIEDAAVEVDDDNLFKKVIKKEIKPEYGRAEVQMVCNRKGWGYDYFETIYVEIAVVFD